MSAERNTSVALADTKILSTVFSSLVLPQRIATPSTTELSRERRLGVFTLPREQQDTRTWDHPLSHRFPYFRRREFAAKEVAIPQGLQEFVGVRPVAARETHLQSSADHFRMSLLNAKE
eukprot:4011250-Amphidinium_carterae.1